MICLETERPCLLECRREDRCTHWKDQGLDGPTLPEGFLAKEQTSTAKPTPKVGDHVRLTGVVTEIDSDGDYGIKTINGDTLYFSPSDIESVEIIRQPFKRGEVVYHIGNSDSEPRTVVTDEKDGSVLLARHLHGSEVIEWDASNYERRP